MEKRISRKPSVFKFWGEGGAKVVKLEIKFHIYEFCVNVYKEMIYNNKEL